MGNKKILLRSLNRKLSDKEREITAVYASGTGRELASLSKSERSALDDEVEDLIMEAEEALFASEVDEGWRAHDERLAATPIGRLIRERHNIAELILNFQDLALEKRLKR
jgi:hypothetical protein